MSELLLKIGGEHASHEDGDIIAAFSERHIKAVHTAELCHKRLFDRQSDGFLLPNDSLPQVYLTATREFRFERVSDTQVVKTRLSDGETIRITSGEPFTDFDGSRSVLHVEEFVQRRRHNDDTRDWKPMFGSPDREVWYGGHTDTSDAVLDKIWDAIEARMDIDRIDPDFQLWPFGRMELSCHLPVRVTDLTDSEARDLVQPEYKKDLHGDYVLDEGGSRIVEKKRRYGLPWQDILDDLGVAERDVLDKGKKVGREKEISIKRWVGRSKGQPNQGKSVIVDKES
jgi:hypothetical protein